VLQGRPDVGKSVLVAGCAVFSIRMADRRAVQIPEYGAEFRYHLIEMGRAQIFQAEAAGIVPDVRMNPVLLKPGGDRRLRLF
jgi:adenosylcobyric acid synthase